MRAFVIGFVAVLAVTANATVYAPIKHPDCPCPIDEDPFDPTHLPVPGDCTKFYKCELGFAYLMDCPARLHWSVYHNRCEHPGLAIPKCKTPNKILIKNILLNKIASAVKTPILHYLKEGPIPHKDCPAIDDPERPKHLPYPNNCTKFYKCSYGKAYPMDCPPGEHFGVEIDRCDWPKVAKCDPNIGPEPEPTTPSPTPEPTTPTTETTTRPTTAEPTTAEPTTAEPTTTESTTAEPTTAEPTSEPTSEPTTSTTPEPLPPGIDCSDVPHGTLYPHPDDCQKFVHCSNGVGAVKRCPGILHFNPVLLVCDWPEAAGCKVKH